MKRVYLARHGEIDANKKECLPTRNEALNEQGRMQAVQLAERVESLIIDRLIASDYPRAQQTVEPTATAKKIQIETNSLFGEMFEPSSFEGLSDFDERVMTFRSERDIHIEDKDWHFEDAENCYDVFMRAQEARKLLEQSKNENIFIISHGYFIKALIAAILFGINKPTKEWFQVVLTLKLSNVGISYLTYDNERWRVVMFNDYAHFAE